MSSSSASTRPRVNLRSTAVKRIMQEANELSSPTEQDFVAAPLETDIFEWHCTVRGVEDSEFAGGLYHLRIILPPTYPMSAPDIILLTPNGRFELGKKICIDGLTSFHAGSWQPAWGVRTAIHGLRSFWMQGGEALSAIGALDTSKEERRRLAKLSKAWVCPTCQCSNKDLIPHSSPNAGPSNVSTTTMEDTSKSAISSPTEKRDAVVATTEADEDAERTTLTPVLESEALSSSSPSVAREESEDINHDISTSSTEERTPGSDNRNLTTMPDPRPSPIPLPSHHLHPQSNDPSPTLPLPRRTIPTPLQPMSRPSPLTLMITRRGVPLWLDGLIVTAFSMLVFLLMRKAVMGGGRDEGSMTFRDDL